MKYRAIIFLICYLVLLVQPVMPMVQYQLGGGCVSDFFKKTYAVSFPCLCAVTAQKNVNERVSGAVAEPVSAAEKVSPPASPAPLASLLFSTLSYINDAAGNTGQNGQEHTQIQDLLNLDSHAVFVPLVFNPVINRFEAVSLMPDFLLHQSITIPACPLCAPPQISA